MTFSISRLSPAESLSLMRAAARGDQQAWGALYHAHETWMKTYLRRRLPPYLRARFDEQDMLQDVFLRLARSPDVLANDDVYGLARYLRELLHNVLADELRHHQRKRRSVLRETRGAQESFDTLVSHDVPPNELAENADLHDFVADALQRLPGPDREILCDRFVACLTWVEISRRIGVSEPTARRRGQEALGRLMQRRA
jgi:RNA polymerase sigma factor (sigma-70 family)